PPVAAPPPPPPPPAVTPAPTPTPLANATSQPAATSAASGISHNMAPIAPLPGAATSPPPTGNEATGTTPALTPIAPLPSVAANPPASDLPQPVARGSGKFLWPVNGKVVLAFGATDGGTHNDGINIAAPLGTPVRAADNGVVVYAGNELRGFGNLLLVRHADGWVSAYAHCDALLVKRGDQVKRGQVIARVGQSGSVAAPQLHFELQIGRA